MRLYHHVVQYCTVLYSIVQYCTVLYSIVQFYDDVFELIFWSYFFNLRNNGTAMAVLAAPLPAALGWDEMF